MRLPQLRMPVSAAALYGCGAPLRPVVVPLRPRQVQPSNLLVAGQRFASVKSQGAYRLKNKKTLPKKLGAKRIGDQYVLPGTIIYKQRGTLWHPGENTILGRDHTIHSSIAGYVKYYRDPIRHPDRQYIGVTYERSDTLPYLLHEPRKRKLVLTAVPRKVKTPADNLSDFYTASGLPRQVIRRPGVVDLSGQQPAEAETVDPQAVAVAAAEAAAAETDATATATSMGGNEETMSQKRESKATRAARRWNAYVRMKRTTRTLLLHKDYSYHESNYDIGRLMGTHKGKTPGTQRYGSRRSVLRHRRKKQDAAILERREMAQKEKEFAMQAKATGGGAKNEKKSKKDKKEKKAQKAKA